jgi:serine/threonine protein kinase
MIVSELMSKDLRSCLDETVHEGQTRPPHSLLLAVDIMLQIAEPMKYLHEKGMMHRDLKANNILINVVESEELCISPSVQVKFTDSSKVYSPSSCNSLGSTKFVGLWLDVCVIRCPFFKVKYIKTFSLRLPYMFPFLFFHISLFSHSLSFLQIIREEEQNLC